jgi:proteasome lid subunit RPN8/RPN11
MLEDARKAFPDECCGFLFGKDEADVRLISDILIVDNSKEGDKRRRFEISPKDYMRAEQWAIERNLTLLGVYHSHPSSPAIPSELDRLAAQPFFSYIIISIYDRGRTNTLSWQLNEHGFFYQEEIITRPLFDKI